MSEQEEEVTLEQATAALMELNTGALDDNDEQEAVVASAPEQPEVEPEPAPVEAAATQAAEGDSDTGTVVADEPQSEPEGTDEETQAPSADVQAMEKRFNDRLEATRQRSEQNQTILRNRLLQKSTASDSALRLLQQTLTEDGVRPEDVKQVIEQLQGTMNPASASYAPPAQPTYQPMVAQPSLAEDQNMVLNDFLDDKGLTASEAEEFGNWIRTEGSQTMPQAEMNVAQHSLDGFLRLAHGRWQAGAAAKVREARTNDAVGAVKSVQRTQRAAAKAASSQPAAPARQPVGSKQNVDVSKLTNDDLSDLFRQSVEQYK